MRGPSDSEMQPVWKGSHRGSQSNNWAKPEWNYKYLARPPLPAWRVTLLCRHRVRLQQCWLLSVDSFFFSVHSNKEATLNGAVLWTHEGSGFLAFQLVSVWYVLVSGFSEQNSDIQPIHPYSPAPCCLPTRTSAPAMQPMPRMQTTIPMKCTALYRTSKKNQESNITTGMTKQSRSCQEKEEKSQINLLTLCPTILG